MFQLISGMGSLLQKIVPFVLSMLRCVGETRARHLKTNLSSLFSYLNKRWHPRTCLRLCTGSSSSVRAKLTASGCQCPRVGGKRCGSSGTTANPTGFISACSPIAAPGKALLAAGAAPAAATYVRLSAPAAKRNTPVRRVAFSFCWK